MRKTIFAVVAAFAVTAAAQQTPPQPAAPSPEAPSIDTVVYRVNGDPVRLAEINLAAQNLAARIQQQGQQVPQERLGEIAVNQVIDTKLLAQEARRRGLEVEPEEVETVLERFQQQSGGAEQLASELGSSGLDLEWLRGVITESQLVQALIEDDIRPTVTVTDEEIDEFYAANPEAFETPEQVRARHILFEAGADASEEERAAARAKAEDARERAAGGEDFAELAKELSEGPSASRGGDLGFFTRERMVEPFATAAFDLEPGEISPVVGTEFGYHVILLEERKPASTRELDDARSEIRASLAAQKTDEKVGNLLTSLRESAEIEPVGPAAAADEQAGAPAGAPDSGAQAPDEDAETEGSR